MSKMLKKGFTLIELLLVIALLGILAVGLLAALNPFEQLKKARDAGTKNAVSEVYKAVLRYYAIKNHMPWCPDGESCTDPAGDNLATDIMKTAITNIIDTGELKSDFFELLGENDKKIFVTGSEANATVVVCFTPISKSFMNEPNTKYDKTGGVKDGCPSGELNECYWCVK